jgi:uncharacterized membrane protein YbhN (UPF0104 family)
LLGFLVHIVGWQEIVANLREAKIWWIVFMYFLTLGARVIEAFQMKILLHKVDTYVSFARIFLANSLAAIYALIIPGDLIASGAKWANLGAATGKKSLVLNAILYNRLALILPALLFGGIAIAWENPFPESALTQSVTMVGMLTIFIFGLLYHPRLGFWVDRICRRLCRPLPKSVKENIERIFTSLQEFRTFDLGDHLIIFLFSSSALILSLSMFTCAARAIGLYVSISTLAWIYAILLSLRQVPITISNLGVRESVLIAILGKYGVASEIAFTLGLVFFTNHVIIALIGAGYQITLNMRWTRWKVTTLR